MTVSKRIAKNTGFSLAATVFSSLFSLAALMVAARRLGVKELGLFSFARAFPLLFIFIADLGVGTILTRQIAAFRESRPEYIQEYVGKIFPLRLFLICAAMALTVIVLEISGKDRQTVIVTSVVSIYVLGAMATYFFYGIFQGFERMEYFMVVKILEALLIAGLFYIFLREGDAALKAGCLVVATTLISLSISMIFFWRLVGPLVPRIDLDLWKETLKVSVYIVLITISIRIFDSTDITLISYMRGDWFVGLYTPCFTISNITGMLNMSYAVSIFPVLSAQFAGGDRSALGKSCEKSLKILAFLGLPVCVGGAILARPMLTTLFGAEYGQASSCLMLLIGGTALYQTYIGFFIHFSLAVKREKFMGKASIICAGANIILNASLIPVWGIRGAAIATALSKTALIITVFIAVIRPYNRLDTGFCLKLAGSLAAMAAVLVPVKNMDIWFSIPLGGIVFLASFLIMKPFSVEELDLLKRTISRR